MATVQRYVDTGATTGGDGTTSATSGATRAYASLSEWEANQGSTATDDYIVDCAATDTGSGNVADTAGSVNIDFAAITTGSVTIQQTGANANSGDTFIDATKYRLIISGTCIRPVKNTTIRRMQLDCTSASGFVAAINLTSPGRTDGLTVEYCRIRSAARAIMGHNASNPAGVGTMIVRNNVFVLSAGTAAIDLDSSGTNNGAIDYDIYHNTIYTNGSKPGVRVQDNSGSATQTVNVENNIVANSTNPFDLQASTGSLTVTTNYNWTDDGGDGTTNEQNLSGTQFTSAGTTFAADFSLTEALATGGAVGSITDDITGTTRGSPPDAGAYEYVSSGSPYTMAADVGSFTLTGVTTGLKAARQLAAAAGTFTLTGIDTALKADRKLAAAVGAFTLTGQDATLVYEPATGDYTLTADTGSFALTGIDTGLRAARKIAAAQATFALTGNATGLARGLRLNAAAASFTLTGISASFLRTYVMPAETSAYTFTGMDVSLSYSGQGIWTPVTPAGGTWTPATPASTTWTPQ
jgi:hypothetical protein